MNSDSHFNYLYVIIVKNAFLCRYTGIIDKMRITYARI
jgi:hypothetical protein